MWAEERQMEDGFGRRKRKKRCEEEAALLLTPLCVSPSLQEEECERRREERSRRRSKQTLTWWEIKKYQIKSAKLRFMTTAHSILWKGLLWCKIFTNGSIFFVFLACLKPVKSLVSLRGQLLLILIGFRWAERSRESGPFIGGPSLKMRRFSRSLGSDVMFLL